MSLLSAPSTGADRIEVTDASLKLVLEGNDPGITLDASFDFELPGVLEDAINRGIALYFVVDFELYRERWWWFDRKLVSESRLFRLTYSPLTRQYRIGSGALALPFESIADALVTMRRIHGWNVIERGVLKSDDDYRAQVRMRLDTSQLPKPFQVNALTNRDWALSSDWRSVPVVPELAR